MSSCLQLRVPAMRVWRGLSARLGLRRPCRAGAGAAGLGRLRKEVLMCEYSDVHVMWEMLSSKPSSGGKGAAAAATRRARTTGRKPVAVVAAWSRLAFYCCGL